jgi:hypothetical protein
MLATPGALPADGRGWAFEFKWDGLRAIARVLDGTVHVRSRTGKDLLARAVHQASARRAAPFVVVDCASLPEALVESALRYPLPGWNEGFTTSAPLAFLSLKGHRAYPGGRKTINRKRRVGRKVQVV